MLGVLGRPRRAAARRAPARPCLANAAENLRSNWSSDSFWRRRARASCGTRPAARRRSSARRTPPRQRRCRPWSRVQRSAQDAEQAVRGDRVHARRGGRRPRGRSRRPRRPAGAPAPASRRRCVTCASSRVRAAPSACRRAPPGADEQRHLPQVDAAGCSPRLARRAAERDARGARHQPAVELGRRPRRRAGTPGRPAAAPHAARAASSSSSDRNPASEPPPPSTPRSTAPRGRPRRCGSPASRRPPRGSSPSSSASSPTGSITE